MDAEKLREMRLEKTDEYTRHRDAMKAQGFAVVHGFKADAMRDELLAALREEREKRRFWNNRNYQLVDKVRCQDWHLAYERAMREVVEAALVYEHEMHIMHDDALRVAQGLIESEGQALAAAREEIERMKVCCLCSRLTGNWVFMCCAEMMEENSAENPDEWPHSSTVVKLDDHCHFTPSRWTPRTRKDPHA